MRYFPQVADENDLPTLQLIKDILGFIRNLFGAQTIRPELMDAEVRFIDAILVKERALTRQYILRHRHCAIVRMLGIQGPEPEQIAIDHTSTGFPMAMKALLIYLYRKLPHQRLPRRACSRSMASNSALKFPLPKLRLPLRWMIS